MPKKEIVFKTKKDMKEQPSPEDMAAFLAGAKDEQLPDNPDTNTFTENGNSLRIHNTYTENVNSKQGIASMIGRGPTFETQFTRQTYYVHNTLIKAIDKLAKKRGKGGKTKIVNEALELYINAQPEKI